MPVLILNVRYALCDPFVMLLNNISYEKDNATQRFIYSLLYVHDSSFHDDFVYALVIDLHLDEF